MPGLLALLAHPDDEFFGAGLLAAVAARGVPVHLAYWTRGEGGGSPRQRFLARCLPRDWSLRSREVRRAGAVLGARSITFLGAIDPVPVGGRAFAPDEDLEVTVEKIESLRARLAPDMLLTHGSDGEYGHAAHRRLRQAAGRFSARLPVLSFAAILPGGGISPRYCNRSDPADFVFDSRGFSRVKMEIVRAHRSQKGVFEFLANRERPSLRGLLRASRLEGYHVAGGEPSRGEARSLLAKWTDCNAASV